MNVITRGIRNAFRNGIRTFSIVVILGLSVGMALAMLIARQAVTDKIASVKSSIGNTVSVSPAGARGFEGGGTALTSTQINQLATMPHVTSVDSLLSDRLTTTDTNLVSAVEAGSLGRRFSQNNGTAFQAPSGDDMMQRPVNSGDGTGTTGTRTFTPTVTIVGTTNATDLSGTTGGGTFKLSSGTTFSNTSSDKVAVVGTTLAAKNNLSVGSTFTAYGQTMTVIGIFDAGNTFSNNQLLVPLKTLQTLSSQTDAVTSATLTVDSIDNVAAVTAAAVTKLGTAADITNDATTAETSIAPLRNIQTISLYSLFGALAAGAVIILLTMIMIVRERRREIGVMKAIGASNVTVMGQFASEATTFTILGAVIGLILGVIAGNPLTKLLVNNSTSSSAATNMMGGRRGISTISRNLTNINTSIGWDIILYGLGVALLIALIGSALASFFIAKVRPAEVMRAE